jgi:hypothetical protein
MGMPIHYYVVVDYDAVKKVVNSMGGVPMDIPFHMYYSDPYDKPPLSIDIPKGHQVLNGDKAVEFLRFRKGAEGYEGYPGGISAGLRPAAICEIRVPAGPWPKPSQGCGHDAGKRRFGYFSGHGGEARSQSRGT